MRGLHADRSELDCERQIVEPVADLGHRVVQLKPGPDGARPGQEQVDSIVVRERRHRVLLLAREVQRLAARDQEIEVRARSEELGESRRRADEVLEVVEEDQHRAVPDVPR